MDELATTPLTEMLTEYRFVRRLRKEQRLAYADALVAVPGELADKLVRSVALFDLYENESQAFNAQPPQFSEKHGVELVSGTDFAKRLLKTGTCSVDGGDGKLDFEYVSRELDCLRVAPGRPLSDGASSKRALVLDLLLVNARDRVPIVAEVKLRKDKDAAYALIQGLAAAAHLVTASQKRRLTNIFPQAEFSVMEPRLDVYVVSLEASERPLDVALRKAAMGISARLLERPDVSALIRRIAFLDARAEGARMSFELAA
jgi:hypothetical protein